MMKKKIRGKRKNRTYQTPGYSNKIQPTIINSNIIIFIYIIYIFKCPK